MNIEFTVPAIPIAQPRHRIGTVGGKARAFEAKKSHPIHAFKATVRHAATKVYSGPPLTGTLTVELQFILPRPKNRIWKTKPMPREMHCKKPDLDNLTKGVLDAINGLMFVDDSQISSLLASKVTASGDEQPHTIITLTEATDNEA